jgi:hypothetical protein
MTRTTQIVCTLVLLLGSMFSARLAHAIDWMPVAPQDLALKDNPKQPGADAMILYRELVIDASRAPSDGESAEEYIRIKVFTQAGVSAGHINIDFVPEDETIPYIAGRTIRPDGSIVKFDGQVLETTIEKASGLKVLAKTFTLPDVQPGCIIEYIFQRQMKQRYVRDRVWRVSESMYTREAHFTYVPFMGYGSNLVPMYSTFLLPADAALKQQANGSYTMAVHDIAGIVEEPLMPPEGAIEARVSFYYQKPDFPASTAPADRYWGFYAKHWNSDLERFVDKKSALDEELSKLVSPGDPPEVKLRKIYAGVLEIRNLNLEDFKTLKENKDENLKENSNVEDVLKHGYGNGHQINLLFVGLARAAGFDATEVYVAPRNQELFLPQRKEVSELKADVVWVHAGTQDYYLDPASRYFPFGLLPWPESGTGGIKADKHAVTIVNTPNPQSIDSTVVRHADLTVDSDGSISGSLQVDFTGQRAALLRTENRRNDANGRTKELENIIRSWLPAGSEFSVTRVADWDNIDQPIRVEGTIRIPSFTPSAAERRLMPLDVFQMTQMREFASEKRSNFVYFHYPYEERDEIKFHLPSGYKVESLPPPSHVDLKAVSCEITAEVQGTSVEITRHLAVNGIIFTKDEYATLRSFFGTVRANDNAQMVLQNSTSAKNN